MSGCLPHLLERLRGGHAVEVDDADGLAPRLLAADVHLGDVDPLVAQGPADEADQAGTSRWVKIKRVPSRWASSRYGPSRTRRRNCLPKSVPGGDVGLALGRDLGLDHRAEVAGGRSSSPR